MRRIRRIGLTVFATTLIMIPLSAFALDDSLQTGKVYTSESTSTLFYLGVDLHRYIFPNLETFNTWYDDFDEVVTLEDDILNQTPIGGLVTINPNGETWVKIKSDPKVYTVSKGGILHWIPTEEVAMELAGENWADRIIDLPDTVFASYTTGVPVDIFTPTLEFDNNQIITIDEDKELTEPEYISIETDPDNREIYVSDVATIHVGGTVHWENNSNDWHPEVILTGHTNDWGSGIIEGGADFITRFHEIGFYHYSCRNAYDTTVPETTNCGTISVLE